MAIIILGETMKYGDKFFYTTETDDVIDFKIKAKKIDKNYKYIHKNIFYRFFAFFTYRFIATPIMAFYYKFIKHIHFKNKKVLKQHKKGGYFIYANHTHQMSDVFTPALMTLSKFPRLITHADNVSMPFWGKFSQMWGALPLPDTIDATKNFYSAIEYVLKKNDPIVIYPEAHLWPFYTKIRNFNSLSFRYPVKYNKPIYTFTTTYRERKKGKEPAIDIYVDGPFYPDSSLPVKEAQQKLRDQAYNQMVERSKLSNYEYVTYEKRSNEND